MAIVWQNSFDGIPGASVTVANSGQHGTPIAGIRNNAPATSVRYGDRAVLGQSSLRLGTDAGSPHGDVWLHYPQVNAYSISFYVYLASGSWFRLRDASVITEFYLSSISSEYVLGSQVLPATFGANLIDRWVRVEISATSARMAYRLYWTDPHSTSAPDHSFEQARAGGTVGGVFTQGGGSAGAPTSYIDQVRVGEGEWLGPWPTHQTLAASASLSMVAHPVEITAHLDDGPIRASATLPLAAHPAQVERGGSTGASAALPLAARPADVTRHAKVPASAALAVAAREATVARDGRTAATAALPLAAHPAEIRGTFRPTFPPVLTTEILLDNEWVDITEDVRTREPVAITRGRADEAARPDPSSLSLLLDNRHGKYSPHNPMSPYYGSLGRNTPIRVRVGPMPDDPEPDLVDRFDRTVANGWGSADTGQAWTGAAAGASVSGGAGHLQVNSLGTDMIMATTSDVPADADMVYSVALDRPPLGRAPGAVGAGACLRFQSGGHNYRFSLAWRVDTGVGGGLRVSADIIRVLDGVVTSLTPVGAPVPGIRYTPGQWVRVRVQADGAELRMRVWPEGTPEPTVWHAQAHDTAITAPGRVALRGAISTGAHLTDLPITVSCRDLDVRPLYEEPHVVRFTGEVASWPVRWDLSDSDVWVPLTAAGIMRRQGQGAKPLRSPLRRTLPLYFPVAYWPLEDGADATLAASPIEGVAPLRVSGMDMAADSTLVPSGPLPTLGETAAMSTGSIPSIDTGAWEVDLLYRLEQPSDPWAGDQRLLSVQSTTITVDLSLFSSGGRPALRRTVTDGGGLELHTASGFIDTGGVGFFGAWRRLRVIVERTGTSSTARVSWINPADVGNVFTFTFNAVPGRVTGVTTRFGPELDGMSLGHMTVWGAAESTGYVHPFAAFAGESARDRMSRLTVGAEVPLEIRGSASESLGPEPVGPLLDVIGQAQEADLGSPGESRSQLGLTYRGRGAMYDDTPALVLDYAAGEISAPFEPEDDDQAVRNDVEVSRSDGSSFQVEDLDGPLGVSRVGRYDEAVTLNLASDQQVAAHAGWRLHLGTVNELRWPSIRLNLANPRLSARVEDIIGLDTGDRIRILNPPPWAQERALDLIVQGYEERLGLFEWEMVLTCTPASPWNTARIANGLEVPPDAPMRADTAGSELAAAVGIEDSALEVVTTRGPAWITTAQASADDLPFDITVGGEIMRVVEVTGDGAAQAFTVQRSVNAIRKAHPAGAVVRLAYPAVTAL